MSVLRYVFHRDFWNVRNPRGGYVAPHLTLTGLLILVALLFSGAFAVKHAIDYTAAIRHARATTHIKSGIKIPKKLVYIAPSTGGPTKHSGGIFFTDFQGVVDQNNTEACSAVAYAESLSYEVNRAHHTHITISPRQLYDIETGGQNIVTSISDYAGIAATNGTVSLKTLSYGPNQHPSYLPAWGVERVPSFARYGTRRLSHSSYLWYYPGAGLGAVSRAREAIARHRIVAFGMDWYYNATQSAWFTGKIGLPQYGDWVAYAHSAVLTRYNDDIQMPDGTRGAFLAANSAGKLFGRDRYGNIHRGHGGFVWISYATIERYAAYGQVVDLGPGKTGGGHFLPPANNPNAPTYQAPFDPGPQTGGAYSPYVHGVILHDTGYDLSPLINYWVSYYHRNGVYEISGPFLVAVAITESSLNQYAPRCCIPGDTSYGTFQFILSTACSLGVCSNIEANLNNPVVSTRLAAEYIDHFHFTHPSLPPPYQYVLFNAGEGVSDTFAYNPSGVAYTNFQHFLVNWNTALAYYMGGEPSSAPVSHPVAQVFHLKLWCRAYTAWKLKGCPSPYWHGHLGVAGRFWAFTKGVASKLGGVGAPEVWHRKQRFMSQRFQRGYSIVTWPTRKRWQPKVARR